MIRENRNIFDELVPDYKPTQTFGKMKKTKNLSFVEIVEKKDIREFRPENKVQ